jgi:hypothetical protein
MSKENKILQLYYAGVLADSVRHYENAGILSLVTASKFKQQKLAASSQLKQLEIENVNELFGRFSQIFGCVEWTVTREKEQVKARGNSCHLCRIAKSIGTVQPCYIYCINPFKAFSEALNPSYLLQVNKTLWDEDFCEFVLKPIEAKSFLKKY